MDEPAEKQPPPARLWGLIAALAVVLALWAAQLLFLEPLPPQQSRDYWRATTPERLRLDIASGRFQPDELSAGGVGALHWAAAWAHDPALIDALIEAGIPPGGAQAGGDRQPIHLAALNPSPAIIFALAQAGADVHAKDSQELTPLHLAAASNPNPAALAVLLKAGADINASDSFGNTPLHKAVTTDASPLIIDALLEAGADLQAANSLGHRPLELAARDNANVAIIERLFEGTPEPLGRPGSVYGRNLLHLAAGGNPSPEALAYLLDQGIDINAVDDNGLNAAHHAAAANSEAAVLALLIERGVDINAPDRNRLLPLHYASAFNPSPEPLALLTRHGSDASAPAGLLSRSPLHMCLASKNADEVCLRLAEQEGQLLLRDGFGYAPLHTALLHRRSPQLLKRLIDLGADLSSTTDNGLSALEMIERRKLTQTLGLD